MSQKKKKKKVVVTTRQSPSKSTTTSSRFSTSKQPEHTMVYGRKNYMLMLLGIGLIALGLALMSGGSMPDANTWDDSIIYSFRRITLAPILILLGLAVELYAIFK